MHSLLKIIQATLPATRADLEAVSAAYNAAKNPTEKHRDAMSLKRKFRSMCLASKHTRTDLARATRCVQDQANQRRISARGGVIVPASGQKPSPGSPGSTETLAAPSL
ncbi:hypothetical protein PHYSODRAFT_286003, partial [Phytophthora sojae]